MGIQTKKIQVATVALKAEPGALSKIYSAFKEAGVNVQASWGYEMGPSEAQAHFYPTDFKKCTTVLTQLGFKPKTENACWMEGDDKVGAYAEVLAKISKAGVNISATDALATTDGRFAAVFFCEEKNFTALCKTIGC